MIGRPYIVSSAIYLIFTISDLILPVCDHFWIRRVTAKNKQAFPGNSAYHSYTYLTLLLISITPMTVIYVISFKRQNLSRYGVPG